MTSYGVNSIKKLEGLEAVRKRPGMYLGDPTSGDALHHCIWEAVDNSVDEHLAGHARAVEVALLADGSVTVSDDGRGIPVGINDAGEQTLELVMTSLHAGGKFDNDSYAVSAGLHGVGISAVNAVSEWLVVDVYREGTHWQQEYVRGASVTDVLDLGPTNSHGTSVRWKWDPAIFSGTTEYDAKKITTRLEELAFLNPGLQLAFQDARRGVGTPRVFVFSNGLAEYVELLARKRNPVTKVFSFRAPGVEVAFVWTDSEEETRCYANNTMNRDGGTHLTGFRAAMTKLIGDYIKTHGLDKGLSDGVQPADIREGLLGVVSVRIPDPSFSSQTKDKLVTPRARDMVAGLLEDQFAHYLEENPGTAKKIAERAVLNARAREAARKAKEEVKRKDFMDPLSLPGKLADCTSKKAWESELFIVEGDSAGGSAKGGRDRRFQAILPLRGKVLNVERASIETILENKEIGTLITALGCGLESTRSYDPEKLRYHKIVLMTDADVDGAHIRTLLLTFLYRCIPRLIYDGYVFIARPPLYGIRYNGKQVYAQNDDELREMLASLPPGGRKSAKITRYKGLGEMNAEALWQTTLNPATRALHPVTISDAIAAETLFYDLMGDDVGVRRDWITAHADEAVLDF